jgi:hypothetical protein
MLGTETSTYNEGNLGNLCFLGLRIMYEACTRCEAPLLRPINNLHNNYIQFYIVDYEERLNDSSASLLLSSATSLYYSLQCIAYPPAPGHKSRPSLDSSSSSGTCSNGNRGALLVVAVVPVAVVAVAVVAVAVVAVAVAME